MKKTLPRTSAVKARSITVDLKTRFADTDEAIYVLFPGGDYSLFETIKSRSVLLLDFPGIPLDSATSFTDLKEVTERMAMSVRLRNWHAAGASPRTEPSRDLADYKRHSVTERRGLYIGALENLIFKAKPGTVVVVPGPGHWGEVLIGEIKGSRTSVVVPQYGGDALPGRSVRWVAKRPKSDFTEALISRLPTPNPFTLLDRSYREEIWRAAFDNLVYDGKFYSKFSTTKKSFNVLDEYRIQSFVSLIAGAFVAVSDDSHDGSRINLELALAFLADNPDLIPELALNINSPGFQRLLSDGITPLVVSVALALALAGCDNVKPSEIEVINTVGGNDADCTLQVGESVRDTFEFLDVPSWQAACQRIRSASEDTGLNTVVKAKEAAG